MILLTFYAAGLVDSRAQGDVQIRKRVVARKGAQEEDKDKDKLIEETPIKGPGDFYIRKRIVKTTRIPFGEHREGTIEIGEKPPDLIEIGETPADVIEMKEKPPGIVEVGKDPPNLITIENGRTNTIELGIKKDESDGKATNCVIIVNTNYDANAVNQAEEQHATNSVQTEVKK